MTKAEQQRIFEREERERRKFERRYSVVFGRAIQRQVNRFLTAANREGFDVATNNVRMYVRPDDIRDSFLQLYTDVGRTFNTLAEDEIKSATGLSTVKYNPKPGAFLRTKDFEMPDSIFTMNLNEYIDRFLGQKITFINQTTESWITRKVGELSQEGIRDGLTMNKQTDNLQNFFKQQTPNFAAYRARRIARTETVAAANYSKNEIIESVSGVQKIWISDTRDLERTRITHQNVAPVKPGERFQVGNDLLKFPGDPDGSPAEVINCRCAVGVERI